MAIKSVAKLTQTTGAALILQDNEVPEEGKFFKDSAGEVTVQFANIPQGPLVLVLQDGHDSRYPGEFHGANFKPMVGIYPSEVKPKIIDKAKVAAEKAAADKAEAAAVAAKAAADKAEAQAAADAAAVVTPPAAKATGDKK